MKKELLSLIILFSLLISSEDSEKENYRDKHLLGELGKISTKHILKYEKIAIHLSNQEDKSHFYLIVALDIEQRTEVLKHKFYSHRDYYINKINEYETVLNLPNYSIYILKIDLGNVQLSNETYTINEEYNLNKKRARRASHIYLQQLQLYITSLKAVIICWENFSLLFVKNFHTLNIQGVLNDFKYDRIWKICS